MGEAVSVIERGPARPHRGMVVVVVVVAFLHTCSPMYSLPAHQACGVRDAWGTAETLPHMGCCTNSPNILLYN